MNPPTYIHLREHPPPVPPVQHDLASAYKSARLTIASVIGEIGSILNQSCGIANLDLLAMSENLGKMRNRLRTELETLVLLEPTAPSPSGDR